MADNALFYGDNLDVLRRYVKDETIDLVYLDPPFNSNASYNVLFGHADGSRAAAQIKAFEDTWRWDQAAAADFRATVQRGGQVAQALIAFQTLLGDSNMLAYLSMMAPRLMELHRVLKPTGSIYLHCDPTASHYLKLLMDAAFDPSNFLNEIVWCYSHGGKSKKHFGRKHDTILMYAKSNDYVFNGSAVSVPMKSGASSFGGRLETDPDGRKYRLVYGTKNKAGETKYYKYYLDEGKIPEDYWTDINSLQASAAERLGYPTQKPEALLERIIEASSNEGDMILDPFCGCGTTIAAAEKLGRSWIGIDITYLAISLIKSRLTAAGLSGYKVLGEPTTADDAAQLAADDPYQFQWWALGLIGARPAEGKKGADKGVDGRLFFFDEGQQAKQVVVSVKGGKLKPEYVRELPGVVEAEKAQIGVLVSLNEPTPQMRAAAASAGIYSSLGNDYPRVQLYTVAELLSGKRIAMPVGAKGTEVALPPTPEETVHPDQMTLGN